MRKGFIKVVLFAVVVLGLVSSVYATSPKKSDSVKEMINIATGKVTNYNWTVSTITVLSETNVTYVFQINNETKIVKARKDVKMKDIKIGNEVGVAYLIKDKKYIAKTITIQVRKK